MSEESNKKAPPPDTNEKDTAPGGEGSAEEDADKKPAALDSTCNSGKDDNEGEEDEVEDEDQVQIKKPQKRRKISDVEVSAHNRKWDEMFDRLVAFKEKHGNCLVPNRYIEDPPLGHWVSSQRRQYKMLSSGAGSSAMTAERATRLESIGFDWATTDPRHVPWNQRYQELCDFVKKHGHAEVPMRWKENIQLSNWVSKQRHDYKLRRRGTTNRLSDERFKLLNDIGFVWEASKHDLESPKAKSRKSKLGPGAATATTAAAAVGPANISATGSSVTPSGASAQSQTFPMQNSFASGGVMGGATGANSAHAAAGSFPVAASPHHSQQGNNAMAVALLQALAGSHTNPQPQQQQNINNPMQQQQQYVFNLLQQHQHSSSNPQPANQSINLLQAAIGASPLNQLQALAGLMQNTGGSTNAQPSSQSMVALPFLTPNGGIGIIPLLQPGVGQQLASLMPLLGGGGGQQGIFMPPVGGQNPFLSQGGNEQQHQGPASAQSFIPAYGGGNEQESGQQRRASSDPEGWHPGTDTNSREDGGRPEDEEQS